MKTAYPLDKNHKPEINGPRYKWLSLAAVGLGVLMATIDISIVNVSLPTLVQALRTDFPTIQWVILSYVLVITSTMLSMARLGDMVGKKKIYLLGLTHLHPGILFMRVVSQRLLADRFSGTARLRGRHDSIPGAALVTEAFPARERGRALGVIGGIVSVGLALGPPIGGLIIGLASWHWIFLINIPIGFLAFGATGLFIPSLETKRESAPLRRSGRTGLVGHRHRLFPGHDHGPTSGLQECPRFFLLLSGAGLGLGLFTPRGKKIFAAHAEPGSL